MKYVYWFVALSLLLVGSLPGNTFGKFEYEVSGPNGDENYDRSSDVLGNAIDDLRSYSDIPAYGRKIIKDQAYQSLWSKMNRSRRLSDHANWKLHFELKEETARYRYYWHTVERERKKQQILAEAWYHSGTGKRDGRSWFALSDEERHMYERRFDAKHNPALRENSSPNPLDISEDEYAGAWELSNMGKRDVPAWRQIRNFKTKNEFRKHYYAFKATHLPIEHYITDEEYEYAWEVSQIGKSSPVAWNDLDDEEARNAFRTKYHSFRLSKIHAGNAKDALPKPGSTTHYVYANYTN